MRKTWNADCNERGAICISQTIKVNMVVQTLKGTKVILSGWCNRKIEMVYIEAFGKRIPVDLNDLENSSEIKEYLDKKIDLTKKEDNNIS